MFIIDSEVIMLKLTRNLLVVLKWANWIIGIPAALVCGLLWLFPSRFIEAATATNAAERPEAIILFLGVVTLLLLIVMPATHALLTRLIAMIDTVASDAVFSTVNADRLRGIAWSLLAINLADLGFGLASYQASVASGEYFGWSPSLTGWIAVLLLFVLAEVFQRGSIMRAELAELV